MDVKTDNSTGAAAVKAANRTFYNHTADSYEQVDGRRSATLAAWLKRNLQRLRADAPGGRLLDVGTGSGFLCRCAEGVFDFRCGTDIAENILAANASAFEHAVVADTDTLPFATASFDVVTCFAVLHHLYDFNGLVREVARILKPGGIFYTDHDMDQAFSRRFRWPLALYRRLHRADQRYQSQCAALTPEVYRLSEWQEDGIDAGALAQQLTAAGFQVTLSHHWYGLNPWCDRFFGERHRGRGWAPVATFRAQKVKS